MISVLLALASTWSINPPSEATRAKQKAYETCVTTTARSFARSRDDADVIATAAITKCRPKKEAYFQSLIADNRGADGRSLGPTFLRKLDERLDQRVRAHALLAITEVRARRAR